ncbi:MAG TPA: hypothetical protein VN455_02010 [Methanotrichaceae archaeon]|nr:hypothetical protein [Methanotrichaceae archaeon]
MFEPKEESLVLEIVRSFFDMPADEMMKIGDRIKKALFDSGAESEEAAVAQLKDALKDMSKEQALMAGVFISGLMRCNLAQQINQQYIETMAEEGAEDGQEPE